jgi:hypothetical protein
VPYVLVGILTLGTALGAGLALTTGPVTVTGTVTDAKPFCSGLAKVADYVYHHTGDQDIAAEEMRLFDRKFSDTVIPTAIANPIGAAITASHRYLSVVDVALAHHGRATKLQVKEVQAAFKDYALNVNTVVTWSKTNCAPSSLPL